MRRNKRGDTSTGFLPVVATTSIASAFPLACQRIKDTIDGPDAAGVGGILIGALLLLRAFRQSPVLRSRPLLYGRCLKAVSPMTGGFAILCYDGELSPCFTIAFLLTVFLLATSFVLRLWGLVRIARSEKARRNEGQGS